MINSSQKFQVATESTNKKISLKEKFKIDKR